MISTLTGNTAYKEAIALQSKKLNDCSLPSASLLNLCQEKGGYQTAMLALSNQQQDEWLSKPISDDLLSRFADKAKRSLAEQKEIEARDEIHFDDFLNHYLKQQ